MTTAGDRAVAIGDKSRWVAELEAALLAGEVDIAVHSAKDVPGELAPGLAILAVPERGDPRDALCGAGSLESLPPGGRVGTSSLRRRSQIHAIRDDVQVVDLRGNVDTRLRRLAEGVCDAIVLALAGLERLGRTAEAGAALDPRALVPAPGQGTLAIEGRTDDQAVRDAVQPLTDRTALISLLAERALVSQLGATCRTPVGAHARVASQDELEVSAYVGLPDGSAWVRDTLTGPIDDPARLGREVAARLLSAGAGELLERADAAAGAPAG
jgi:hydroxymethylbilane synthase